MNTHLCELDLDDELQRLHASISELVPQACSDALLLDALQDRSASYLGAQIANGAPKADVINALKLVRDAGMAAMTAHYGVPNGLPVPFGGGQMPGPTRNLLAAHPRVWLRTFYAALVLREEESPNKLILVRPRTMIHDRVRARPWIYNACNVWRAMFADRDGWQQMNRDTIAEARADNAIGDYGNDVQLPALSVLDVVYRGLDPLDTAIATALATHRRYYEKHPRAAEGLVALPTLAAAVWAHSCGFTTRVECDYIPRWLVVSDW